MNKRQGACLAARALTGYLSETAVHVSVTGVTLLVRNSSCLLLFLLLVEELTFFLVFLHGIQGEDEGVAHLDGDVEVLALAGQCLAMFQTLHCQGLVVCIHHW